MAVGRGASGQFESEAVVGGVFGCQLGDTVPFGVAEVGVHDDNAVEDVGLAGVFDDDIETGLGVLARADVDQKNVVVEHVGRLRGGDGRRWAFVACCGAWFVSFAAGAAEFEVGCGGGRVHGLCPDGVVGADDDFDVEAQDVPWVAAVFVVPDKGGVRAGRLAVGEDVRPGVR